ncbi:hypothetical protein WEI85_03770 [Actinomycetes bacterium KLBMP 9797]
MGAAPFAPFEESGCQRLGWAVAHLPRCPPDRRETGDTTTPDGSDHPFDHRTGTDAS